MTAMTTVYGCGRPKTLDKHGFDAGAETIAAHLATEPAITPVPAVSTIWRLDPTRDYQPRGVKCGNSPENRL